jgi:hypothetical protein
MAEAEDAGPQREEERKDEKQLHVMKTIAELISVLPDVEQQVAVVVADLEAMSIRIWEAKQQRQPEIVVDTVTQQAPTSPEVVKRMVEDAMTPIAAKLDSIQETIDAFAARIHREE